MNILFVVWELDPFFKMGGLGDVARSLPGALKDVGVDVRVMLPYYRVTKTGRRKKTSVGHIDVPYAGKKERVDIFSVLHPITGVIVYFLKNSTYLDIVVSMDTWAFFAKAVVSLLKEQVIGWKPDVLHCNDFHCGFIPLLVKVEKLPIKTILTIHNLAYQGKTADSVLTRIGIDPSVCKIVWWEIKSHRINTLMEGIIHADVVTTVSPTYAKEIMTEEYGVGLNDILKGKEGRVYGILNGIDINQRHSTHQKAVKYPFSPQEKPIDSKEKYYIWQEGKRLNKHLLQKRLGLSLRNDIPLMCFIGRFDSGQKGLEIFHTMLRRIDQTKYQFVILGSGELAWEQRFQWLMTFYPKQISCNFKFDEMLSHQIYAASDFIIIPSRFEPCGLIQMIAMLFGTLPIAHNVGGLHDSIRDGVNGFLFSKYSSEQLEVTTKKAIDIWKHDRKKYESMVDAALTTDFSWTKNAAIYIQLYQKLIDNVL